MPIVVERWRPKWPTMLPLGVQNPAKKNKHLLGKGPKQKM